ncbi:MAG: hypothetical protein RR934_07360 [Gordonibacter sp.]|uniref:hypothetical protein n=1 Tax=Gordonibacter sp. TaxID=1968902 RepID=UPI00321FB348
MKTVGLTFEEKKPKRTRSKAAEPTIEEVADEAAEPTIEEAADEAAEPTIEAEEQKDTE